MKRSSISLPICVTSLNISKKLPEVTNSVTGLTISPFSIKAPDDWTLNAPEIGFKPACNPATSVI